MFHDNLNMSRFKLFFLLRLVVLNKYVRTARNLVNFGL